MSHQAVAKPKLRRTPHEEVGPMYPVVKPADRGFDLTVNPANGEKAKGEVVYLSGRVLDTTGAPIAGAHVELWQTNMHGRYDHPADPNPAPLDENFEGFGTAVTGGDGRYAFKTVKPAASPASAPGWWRPPHIHYWVRKANYRDLVTQLYFRGDPHQRDDQFIRPSLIIELREVRTPHGTYKVGNFDIVLAAR